MLYQAWFKAGKKTSPLTGAVLTDGLALVQNHTLRLAIEEYVATLERRAEDEDEVALPVLKAKTVGRSTAEDLAAADEHHRQALNALPLSGFGGGGSRAASPSSGAGEAVADGPRRVAAYLEAKARLDPLVAARYAASLAEHGYETLAFVSMGDFSRRTLIAQLGVLPGHAAPVLRAIQVMVPVGRLKRY
jgi:hypothetical protein